MHVLTFLFTTINVFETREYTVTCIIYSQLELVFGQVYSVATDWTHLWVMLLHLLISSGMTTVNLFITFINSLCADAFCACMHDIISSSSLFFLGRCHCMQIPVRMQHHRLHHAFPWCMPCMVHCTSASLYSHSLSFCVFNCWTTNLNKNDVQLFHN